jgi:predicted transcriptional regulator
MYNLISFVSRGKIRKRVLENLFQPHTPTELSHTIETHRSTTSRTILALKSKGLVMCITPKETMGRYYKITKLGLKILGHIKHGNTKKN